LLDAFDAAVSRIDACTGQIYNVGGGPSNVLSLRELLVFLSHKRGSEVQHGDADWRPGDQRVYVSDVRKAQRELGWTPQTSASEGLAKLYDWVAANKKLFEG
jgi:CDP-paratose 2-epimerase